MGHGIKLQYCMEYFCIYKDYNKEYIKVDQEDDRKKKEWFIIYNKHFFSFYIIISNGKSRIRLFRGHKYVCMW